MAEVYWVLVIVKYALFDYANAGYKHFGFFLQYS